MNKIVVGVDFSSESRLAARQAIVIARRTGAEVVLAHVAVTVELPPVGPDPQAQVRAAMDSYRTLLAGEIERDRDELASLRRDLGGQGPIVSHVLAEGFPEDALGSAAAELGADLIVVGTHGRSGLRWFALGNVAQKVIRGAEVDVLVARRECPAGGFRRVLVGFDFTASSKRALARAIELASPDARIDVAHFFHFPTAIGWGAAITAVDPDLIEETAQELSRQAEKILAEHRGTGLDLRFSAIHQDAVSGLVHLSERDPYDLVALGSHGRRGVRRALLGSVAEAVARRAPCSVLVGRGTTAL